MCTQHTHARAHAHAHAHAHPYTHQNAEEDAKSLIGAFSIDIGLGILAQRLADDISEKSAL